MSENAEPARYYVMEDGERRGPYTLAELVDAGVRPDTYVWTKGMSDWQKAEEDADICWMFRQRLAELRRPAVVVPAGSDSGAHPEASAEETPVPGRPGFHNLPEPEFDPAEHDPGEPPPSGMLTVAVLATLFCFPVTGAVAIYYAVRARRLWAEALRSNSRESYRLYDQEERDDIRHEMSASVRSCKMWTGITVCLGLMFYAAAIHLL